MINITFTKLVYFKEDEEKWDWKVTHRELLQYWYSRLQVVNGYYFIIENGEWMKNGRSLPNIQYVNLSHPSIPDHKSLYTLKKVWEHIHQKLKKF